MMTVDQSLKDALDWVVRATDIELTDPQNEEKLNVIIKAAREKEDAITIERYVDHHVRLHDTWFTIWHPLTCDLDVCDIYDRCRAAWVDKPAPLGVYSIDSETLKLSPPGEKKTYRMTEVVS